MYIGTAGSLVHRIIPAWLWAGRWEERGLGWDIGHGTWDMGGGIWDMGYGIWGLGLGLGLGLSLSLGLGWDGKEERTVGKKGGREVRSIWSFDLI
ncbi:hypothetical protein EYC80_001727 [Monilinia laxa]|uniref:Uncharacterized protein n=1 Tax=Monilinia laxa TaxID=61186 RepID=A0A5N6K5S8_MONLA|nr:hypothetical protein EYC80_001727 [Monilinia laxa]